MSDFLQQHAGFHFALVLVQLAIHELPGMKQWIVVPSIPMRTTNIVRGIVQIADRRADIAAPPERPAAARASTLSEDEFLSSLDRIQPQTSDRLIAFLKSCDDLQVTWEVTKTLIVRMVVEEFRLTPFVISSNGSVDTGYTAGHKDVMHGFMKSLSVAISDAAVKEASKTWVVKKRDGTFFNVWDLLNSAPGVRGALEILNRDVRKAADNP